MNISKIFKNVKSDLSKEDLMQLDLENFSLFNSLVKNQLESYDKFSIILKKYGLDIKNIYFSSDFFHGLWYIDEPAYVNLYYLLDIDNTLKNVLSYKRFIQSHFENGDWVGGFVIMNDLFRVNYFLNHYQEIDIDKVQDVLSYLYIDREFILEKMPKDLIKSIFKQYGVDKLSSYDDEITIYRGQTNQSTNMKDTLSWSLDFDTARFFATRFKSKGVIYKASIKKEDIIMYTNDRGENEVLVDFENIKNMEKIREY